MTYANETAVEQLAAMDGPFLEALEHFQKALWDYQCRFKEDKGHGLNEISNALSHLIQYADESLDITTRNKNLEKAANHLIRGCLDMYKLIFIKHGKTIIDITKSSKGLLATNMQVLDILRTIYEFKERGRHARKIEVRNVGVNPLDTVCLYDDAVTEGDKLCSAYRPEAEGILNKILLRDNRLNLWWAVALAIVGELVILAANELFG
jgi:hypothetical protein